MKRNTIDRRTFAKASAAGLGLMIAGCSDGPTDDGEQPLAIVAPFKDQGRRLYGVVPTDGPQFDDKTLPHMDPRPVWRYETWRNAELQPKDPQFHCIIWATKEDADRLLQSPEVKSVIEKKPEHVFEIGQQAQANGQLAVQFLPNSRNYAGDQSHAASLEQIALEWRKATDGVPGVVINVAPTPTLQETEVAHPDPQQVIIQFKTPTLSPDVLDVVKRHPQTMSLKWSGPFMVAAACPGCGMG